MALLSHTHITHNWRDLGTFADDNSIYFLAKLDLPDQFQAKMLRVALRWGGGSLAPHFLPL